MHLLFLLSLVQWRFGRPRQHTTIGLEARAVTGTVPGCFRAVPVHDTTHVRANGRQLGYVAAPVAICGHALTVELKDLALAAFELGERRAFGRLARR